MAKTNPETSRDLARLEDLPRACPACWDAVQLAAQAVRDIVKDAGFSPDPELDAAADRRLLAAIARYASRNEAVDVALNELAVGEHEDAFCE